MPWRGLLRAVRIVVGSLGVLASLVAFSSAEATLPGGDRVTFDCREPAVVVLFRGSHIQRGDHTTDARRACRRESGDQVLGAAIFGGLGLAVLVGPLFRRWILRRRPTTPARPPLPAPSVGGLAIVRTVFVLSAIFWLLVGAWAGAATTRKHTPSASVAVVLLVTIAGLVSVGAFRLADRPLDCTDDLRLARSYINVFAAKLAVVQIPILAGLGASVATGSPWVSVLGLLFGASGYARLAPTTARLERDQQALTTVGCGRSLVAALQTPLRSGRPESTE